MTPLDPEAPTRAGAACNPRVAAAAPFASLAGLAIIGAGGMAAAIAYHATEPLVWAVAYLVLVVGVMQLVLGVGQAWLAVRAPGPRMAWGQWIVFNLANAGVIGGTLVRNTTMVAAATALFAIALAWFLVGVRRCRHRGWAIAYRSALALVLVSACVGLAISAISHGLA